MGTIAQLLGHETAVLQEIEKAAKKKDPDTVVSNARRLEKIRELIAQQEAIHRAVRSLEPQSAVQEKPITAEQNMTAELSSRENEAGLSSKERGRRRRLEFIRVMARKGVLLEAIRGATFMAPSGLRTGIAFAREVQKDRWFLGLPEGGFEHAVLLCETQGGRLIHFSLPKEFIARHEPSLSRKNGQVKFSLVRRGGEFFLQVPRRGRVSVNSFRDDFSRLR